MTKVQIKRAFWNLQHSKICSVSKLLPKNGGKYSMQNLRISAIRGVLMFVAKRAA